MTLSKRQTGLHLLPPVWLSVFLACFRASGVSGYLERHSQWEWAAVPDQRLPLKRRSVSVLKSYWFIVEYQLNLFIIVLSLWLELFFLILEHFHTFTFLCRTGSPFSQLSSYSTSLIPEWIFVFLWHQHHSGMMNSKLLHLSVLSLCLHACLWTPHHYSSISVCWTPAAPLLVEAANVCAVGCY